MKWILLFIIYAILICACTPTEVTYERLELRDSRYYLIGHDKPYNGKLITELEKGKVGSEIEMKNGVPNGKWFAYGYKREIIQEGAYKPIEINAESELRNNGVKRLNVCDTKEGDEEITQIYVITDSSTQIKRQSLQPKIISLLHDLSIEIKGDTVDQIIYMRGEFEDSTAERK